MHIIINFTDLYLLHAGFAVSNQPHFEALNPDRQFVDQLGREEWHQRLVVCVYFEKHNDEQVRPVIKAPCNCKGFLSVCA